MGTLYSILLVSHVITAILMVWPFYALVVVNQRAHLGPPLGDRTDTYMENIIKNRAVPCFVFQATALLTGVALVLVGGFSLGTLLSNPVLGVKLLLLVLIGVLLAYAHHGLQPRIDALFAEAAQAGSGEVADQIGSLRLRRKRMASVCLFVVLIESMLGVQVWAPFPVWLTALLAVALALFTWRAYSSVTPFGWV
jgi:hypothetical protein